MSAPLARAAALSGCRRQAQPPPVFRPLPEAGLASPGSGTFVRYESPVPGRPAEPVAPLGPKVSEQPFGPTETERPDFETLTRGTSRG